MKDKIIKFEQSFHRFFNYFITEWFYPLMLISCLALITNYKFADSGLIGFVVGVLIVCYTNSYKEKD